MRLDLSVTSLLSLHRALQRMLVLPREIHHLRDLGLGDLIGEEATKPDAVLVNVKHDPRRVLPPLVEELFQHKDDKLHRRIIVVEQQNLVKRRLLGFWLGFSDNADIYIVIVIPKPSVIIRHALIPQYRLTTGQSPIPASRHSKKRVYKNRA